MSGEIVIETTVVQTNLRSMARHLEKSVFGNPQPPDEKERQRLFAMGIFAAFAFCGFAGLLSFLIYFLVFGAVELALLFPLQDWFYAEEGRQAVQNIRTFPVWAGLATLVGLGFFFYRSARETWEQEKSQRALNLSMEIASSIISLTDRVRMVLRFFPEFSARMMLFSYYPELKFEASPFSLPAAGIVALLARDKELFSCDPIAQKVKEFAIDCDVLTSDEAKRLLLKHSLIVVKKFKARNEMELQAFVLTETGELLAKRFDFLK